MSDKHQHGEQERVPATRRRKAIPLRMARGPQDYVPGQQEEPAVLTSLGDMIHRAQNWARSRSIWPFRACLKRDDSREIEAVHLAYEKEPTVPNRSDRPSVGLYQRIDSCCKARRPTAQLRDASGRQCDLVYCREWMPMAHAAAGVSSVAECVHLLPAMA